MKIKKTKHIPHVGKTYLLYARVSPKGSTWNAEETSIALQIQQMKDYILRKDPDAKFIIREDEFKSGKNLNRAGIQSVLDDLDQPDPPWHTLVVWALDRLSRSLVDAVPIFEKLRDAGRGFVCIRQEYLSTEGAMARFTLNQTILIAQLEREMTSERVKEKMKWIAAKGKIPSGKIPIGYRRKVGVKNEIEPDPETMPVVQDIFRRYLAQTETVVDLKRRYAKYIYSPMQLYRMLRNRIYIGEVEYDGEIHPGQHEAIVDREMFDAVNAMLPGERRAPRPTRQKYKYLLTGLVKCHCGKNMVPYSVKKGGRDSDRRYFYYKCQDTLNCKHAINAERLDAEVLEAVKKIAVDQNYITDRYNAWLAEEAARNNLQNRQLQDLETEFAETKSELEKLDNIFISGIVNATNKDYWNDKLTAARARHDAAEHRLQGFRDALQNEPEHHDDLPALLQSIRTLADLLESSDADDPEADYLTKRNILLAIVQYVKCTDNDGGVELGIVMNRNNKWRRERDSNPRYGINRTTV